MLVYLGLGCLGFPVFAGGRSGIGALVGPTGGYLLGFVLGAWSTGMVALRWNAISPRNRRIGPYLAASFVGGIIVVHAAGVIWLSAQSGRTLLEAFTLGSSPFLVGDLLKAVGAALVAGRLWAAGIDAP